MKYLSAEEIRSTGVLHELNRLLLHPVGLAAQVNMTDGTLLIQDWREDPEGVRFDEVDTAKIDSFYALWCSKRDARTEALGYFVQPR